MSEEQLDKHIIIKAGYLMLLSSQLEFILSETLQWI